MYPALLPLSNCRILHFHFKTQALNLRIVRTSETHNFIYLKCVVDIDTYLQKCVACQPSIYLSISRSWSLFVTVLRFDKCLFSPNFLIAQPITRPTTYTHTTNRYVLLFDHEHLPETRTWHGVPRGVPNPLSCVSFGTRNITITFSGAVCRTHSVRAFVRGDAHDLGYLMKCNGDHTLFVGMSRTRYT